MPPPLLAVEVVSPGELQRSRDYVAKRVRYETRGIFEYWIIDPELQTVLILQLSEGNYREVGSFSGESKLLSPQFPKLNITAAQIFEF